MLRASRGTLHPRFFVPLADLVQVATVSKRPPCFPIVETSIGFHEVTKFMPNLFIGKNVLLKKRGKGDCAYG